MCMLSGSIVRVWGALESVLARYEGVLSKSDRTMRVVRVDFGDATSLIGMHAALSACMQKSKQLFLIQLVLLSIFLICCLSLRTCW